MQTNRYLLGKCYDSILTNKSFSLVVTTVLLQFKHPERALKRLRQIRGTPSESDLHLQTLRYTDRQETQTAQTRVTVKAQGTHPKQLTTTQRLQEQLLRQAFQPPGPAPGTGGEACRPPAPSVTAQTTDSMPVSERGDPLQAGPVHSPLDALICRRRPTRSSPMGVLRENVNGRNRAETAL